MSNQTLHEHGQEQCPKTQHIDGKSHGWLFDGDDPYVVCAWCHERRDALTDRVIR